MHNLKNIYRGGLGGHVCFQCRRYASVKTHYEVLGVAKSASQKEIKSAYIDLSKKFHPDTAGSTSKTRFTEINEAYSVLNKPLSRKEYDNRIAYESASRSHSFYGDNRPPGSGRPRYPPPGSGRPGYPPPPGYERDQRYNQWSSNQQYNPYSEAERKRHDYSELRRRYEYFYGPHGKENRQRTKASAEEYKSQADQEKEVLNVITICVVLALLLTLLRFTGIGKFAANSRADQIRSPSDDMKAEIDRSIVPRRAEEKDITPPRM